MKMHFEMTKDEQISDLKKRMERVGYRNLWLEVESESLKGVIRDLSKECEALRDMLLEEFIKSAEKSEKD